MKASTNNFKTGSLLNTVFQEDDEIQEEKTSVDLSSTKITLLPNFEMKNLKQLYLENNNITDLPENLFVCAPNLRWLDLRNNKITNLPQSLTNHLYLETILLQNNKITHLPLYLGTVKSLKHLKLAGNPIVFPKMNIIKSGIETVMKFLSYHYEKEREKLNNTFEDDVSMDVSVESTQNSEELILQDTQKYNESKITKKIYPIHEEFNFGSKNVMFNNVSAESSKYNSNIIQDKLFSDQSQLYQMKSPSFSIKKQNIEQKTPKRRLFEQKKVDQPKHSVCKLEYEKEEDKELHKTQSTLFRYFNTNRYVKKSKVLNKHEQTLKIVQTAMDEKILEKKKELLSKREKVIQDRKSLEALKHWRNSYKDSKDSNTHIYYTLNLSNLPYDTDIERVKILTRADIEHDLPDKYKKNIRNKCRGRMVKAKEKSPLQLRILEVASCMDGVRAGQVEDTPRTKQKAVINEIKKLTDLRRQITKLKLDNDIGV